MDPNNLNSLEHPELTRKLEEIEEDNEHFRDLERDLIN